MINADVLRMVEGGVITLVITTIFSEPLQFVRSKLKEYLFKILKRFSNQITFIKSKIYNEYSYWKRIKNYNNELITEDDYKRLSLKIEKHRFLFPIEKKAYELYCEILKVLKPIYEYRDNIQKIITPILNLRNKQNKFDKPTNK